MLEVRLEWMLKQIIPILPLKQSGFRKGRSATENFVSLISDMKRYFYSHSNTVFVIIQGAFDKCGPTVLANIIAELDLPAKVF